MCATGARLGARRWSDGKELACFGKAEGRIWHERQGFTRQREGECMSLDQESAPLVDNLEQLASWQIL